jgi:hypothetical protein
MSFVGTLCLVQEVAGQDYYIERGEAEEDKAEDGDHEKEEIRADAVRDEPNDGG